MLRKRQHPPFTMRFLRQKLDEIIGPGRYEASVDIGTYTLHIDAATPDIGWFQEVQALIGRIKPAEIVYSYSPLTASILTIGGQVQLSEYNWNYQLNGGWALGEKPFADIVSQEVKNMPQGSVQDALLADHAQFTAQEIFKVVLNGVLTIDSFQKATAGNTAEISYTVPEGFGDITGIQFLKEDNTVLLDMGVFFPAAAQMSIRHTLEHKEEIRGA